MTNKETPELIHLENLTEEDKELLFTTEKPFAEEGSMCPKCSLNTIIEENIGFERVSYCSSCDYYAARNIE